MTKLTPPPRMNQETSRTRRRRLVLAFLAGSLFFLSLGLQAAQEPGWRLEEVLSVGGPKSDLLSMWVGLAVDKDGYLYLTDNVQCSLMKFDSLGRLVKKTGRRGRGPGEFLAPREVDVSGQSVYVVDAKIQAIQVFDKDLNYQRRIPLSYAVMEVQGLPNDLLAVPGIPLIQSEAGKIIILDQTGRHLRSVAFHPPEKNAALSMCHFVFAPGGEMYAALSWLDRIVKVDVQGKTVWTKSLFDPARVKAEYKTFLGLPTTTAFLDVALDLEGRLFVLGGVYCRNPHRDVYVLSPDDGRLIGTLTLPQSSHCLTIDQKGFLYCRADKGMTLKKFRIVAAAEKP
ncbi:MAG TPA: 6-bladed beta-propeller [Acidobacteriota bacterium]